MVIYIYHFLLFKRICGRLVLDPKMKGGVEGS